MITSSSNQKIKNLSALMKKAKERERQQAFVVEGPKMCFETPCGQMRAIYVSESFWEQEENRAQLQQYCGQRTEIADCCEVVSDAVFRSVSDTRTPQGILAIVGMPHYSLEELLCGEKTHLLIVESIQDPGNLGTMFRAGEGAGITGVIMNRTTVDLFNPKTIRSTMGSIYRVPFYVSDDLQGTLRTLQKSGIAVYAAHLGGTMLYDEPDYTSACGFLIGNEGNGLSEETAALAAAWIKIPMMGSVESLNAAVSASLLCYECNRQRRSRYENLV